MYCVVGVWLIVLASSSTLYGKVPRLVIKKISRLAQAVVGALLCNFSSKEHEGLSTHVQRGCSAEPFMRSILSLRIFTSCPGSCVRFFIEMQIQYPASTLLHSIIIRLYPQNPVFEVVHDESVKVHLHMYNGNVQQNPLWQCVESCVTKEFSRRFFISMQIQCSCDHTFVQQ